MNAVIVAAGTGSRLKEVTGGRPKCLVEVGGHPLIQRAAEALKERGVKDLWIVVGHRDQEVRQAVGDQARYLVNPFYPTTNNMASLWLAAPHLWHDPFLYLHADVAFQADLLDPLIEQGDDTVGLLVDPDSIDEEAMKVRIKDGRFIESSKQIPLNEAGGEWTGIARFTPRTARQFHAHAGRLLLDGEHQAYDTAAFNRMAAEGTPFQIHRTHGKPWLEIDTPDDLETAHRLFPTPQPEDAA